MQARACSFSTDRPDAAGTWGWPPAGPGIGMLAAAAAAVVQTVAGEHWAATAPKAGAMKAGWALAGPQVLRCWTCLGLAAEPWPAQRPARHPDLLLALLLLCL
jgi:hypothetical protein